MTFRYTRHSQNIQPLIDFYTQILRMQVLGNFDSHDGYNGVFLGLNNQNWHLEFTEDGNIPQSIFDEDDALVFYPQTEIEYMEIIQNIESQSISLIKPKNPYWQENGISIQDPDGCYVIISNMKIVK